MKHFEIWDRCAQWAGLKLDSKAVGRLEIYEQWLATEAIDAGGLGPRERDRVHDRHIGDSLIFAGAFDTVPERVLDVGSGVGLPGIPLAITLVSTSFTLLDRSGRRTDLMRRAIRILELENVTVEQGEIERRTSRETTIVSRATLPPARARELFYPMLSPDGIAVLGGSWTQRPDDEGWTVIEIPPTVLDHRIWLLKMRQT